MVTSPTEPPRRPELHEIRNSAESFGTDAERYDRTRPTYPATMVEQIVAAIPGPDVLDVGIGTGVSAQPFLAAGCRVLGVDPDRRMATLARQRGIDVEVATFEGWDPAGRTFDGIIAGQAWHWVDPAIGATKAAALLRPGGRLALFWNVLGLPDDLAKAFAAVYHRVLPDSPFGLAPGLDSYAGIFAKAGEGIRETGSFNDPEQWRFDWERPYTTDQFLEQVPTFGGHRQFPPEKLEELLVGIGRAIDATGGSFIMGYTAVVLTATTSRRGR